MCSLSLLRECDLNAMSQSYPIGVAKGDYGDEVSTAPLSQV